MVQKLSAVKVNFLKISNLQKVKVFLNFCIKSLKNFGYKAAPQLYIWINFWCLYRCQKIDHRKGLNQKTWFLI